MADTKCEFRVSKSLNLRNELQIFAMFDRIGCHLNPNEVKAFITLSGRTLEPSVQKNIKTGKDLLRALCRQGFDEPNFYNIINILKLINRYDLLHMIPLRKKAKVSLDPVEEYLKNISQVPQNVDPILSRNHTLRLNFHDAASLPSDDRVAFPPPNKRLRRSQRISTRSSAKNFPESSGGHKKKYTCDVRLRVRAEYCNHQSILQGNVSSAKPDPVDRQLECFTQASAILRSRDLGYIVCDIKFSEITYLDAFWRDYLNGSLLEALKGVFITESLKQAVGNEAIKLLVNVEESDYDKGRSILMNNLHQSL